MITYKTCNTKDNILDSFLIRYKVFVEEQGIKLEDEYDFVEKNREVILVFDDVKPIATGRIHFLNNQAIFERICVLKEYRGKNVGKFLVKSMMDIAFDKGINDFLLGAQLYALKFYEKIGFIAFGEIYLDAGIEHRHMQFIQEK